MPKATTVRFTDEMFARLDQASARTGMPVNSIVIAACLEWMQLHTPDAAPAARSGPRIPLPAAPRWATLRRAVELAAEIRPAPGMYPFDAFTKRAQSLLTRAQGEAQTSGHSYIGTEHLLLAAVGDPKSQATQALAALGVTEDKVRPAIDEVLKRPERKKNKVVVPTSRVRKVVELAFVLSHRADDSRVGTGHLLVALATEGDGIAAHVMKDLGADLAAVEAAVGATEPET